MRMKKAKIFAELFLIIIGLAVLGLGLFAYQLHLDNNQAMGPNRIVLACLGFILLLGAIILNSASFFHRIWISPVLQKTKPFFIWMKVPYLWLIASQQENPESKPSRRATGWFAVAGAAIAIFITLWYITSGKLFTWAPSTIYFDRQANAFLAGRLALLEIPPASLANLTNPYLYQNRESVGGYIWDASYYKGKYYYYWGPVPGLMAASVKLFHPSWVIEDQYLIFFSLVGIAIVLAALFFRLQRKFFPGIPGWVIMALTLLGVLSTPVLWLVTHPDVHEVPIAIGQFFLILGFYTAMRGMENGRHQVLFMILTGFFWGAAIGSRIDLAFGIAWMFFLVCLFLFFGSGKRRISFGTMLALFLPLVIWGAGLAWFNYARFGNILETGHRYQLTGGALPADYRNIVSASYILPNLYNLLARPMEVHWREFPFFFTPFLRNTMWPKYFFFPRDPNYFYIEPITGIFISLPVIWLLLFPFLIIPIRNSWDWLKERPTRISSIQDLPLSTWLVWMAAGAFLLNLGTLSLFIYSTMRYEADLTPLLTILVALFLGWAGIVLHSRTRLLKTIFVSVAVLIIITITISLFANFQNVDWTFQSNNPKLYQAIAHFFTGR